MTRLYRPSNGTEGMMFEAEFCDRCCKSLFWTDDQGCAILGNALFHEVDEPEYPKEWTYDDKGNPTCTAFELDDGSHQPTPKLDEVEFFGKPGTEELP